MSDPTALAGFVAKWRARWPEWSIAQVFVPAAQRDVVAAWFALLQELTDAAWGGSDPTPGLAKLAWWQEELRGWSKGARRHPLGDSLQRLPAPWSALGASLMALQQSRERSDDAEAAIRITRPFAAAVAECEAALFGVPADASALVGTTLLAERLLADPQAAVPSSISTNAGTAMDSAERLGHRAAIGVALGGDPPATAAGGLAAGAAQRFRGQRSQRAAGAVAHADRGLAGRTQGLSRATQCCGRAAAQGRYNAHPSSSVTPRS